MKDKLFSAFWPLQQINKHSFKCFYFQMRMAGNRFEFLYLPLMLISGVLKLNCVYHYELI